MKIKDILIIFILSVLIVGTVGAISYYPVKPVQQNNTPEPTTNTLTDTMLQAEFQRIHQLPYEQYQCRQKSDLLKTYIHKYDKTGELYTVSVPHKDGTYSHVYVEYRGYVYDPTGISKEGKLLYKIDKELWQQQLEVWGFTEQGIVRNGWDGEVDT